ncbi:MAG: glutamate--tRNA ligase family protein [Puniceicoccaceae bacterium]
MSPPPYRGRLAPTPSGYLHAGHARTFAAAWKRARQRNGTLVYRLEDIDRRRSRPEYARAAEEDLRWLGLDWDEGGGRGGPVGPYVQSERIAIHRRIWHGLIAAGRIYPAPFSRRDILRLDPAREADGGIRFPEALRPASAAADPETADPSVNWRFRVPEGRAVRFTDGLLGETVFAAGRDFGDFLVWRREGGPSYELAVVADDIATNRSSGTAPARGSPRPPDRSPSAISGPGDGRLRKSSDGRIGRTTPLPAGILRGDRLSADRGRPRPPPWAFFIQPCPRSAARGPRAGSARTAPDHPVRPPPLIPRLRPLCRSGRSPSGWSGSSGGRAGCGG